MKNGLVWLIGKPGSGKTTVGSLVASLHDDTEYYSFSSLLKEFQKEIGPDGFLQETREQVYQFLSDRSTTKLVIVSGNPYTSTSFSDMKRLATFFQVVCFSAPDKLVLQRLNNRNREIFIHDGASQVDRLERFNKNIQPLIEEILSETGATIFVEGKTEKEVANEVISIVVN